MLLPRLTPTKMIRSLNKVSRFDKTTSSSKIILHLSIVLLSLLFPSVFVYLSFFLLLSLYLFLSTYLSLSHSHALFLFLKFVFLILRDGDCLETLLHRQTIKYRKYCLKTFICCNTAGVMQRSKVRGNRWT